MSVALTDCPKVAPLRQNLFVCQYWHSPFHNFSQGQLDLAMLTGEMIEDIIGQPQHPCSQNRAHTRMHTLCSEWQVHTARTHSIASQRYNIRCPNNEPGLISIIMIHTLYWRFKVRLWRAHFMHFLYPITIIFVGRGSKGGTFSSNISYSRR